MCKGTCRNIKCRCYHLKCCARVALKPEFSSAVLWQVTIANDNRMAVEMWNNADIIMVHVKHLLKQNVFLSESMRADNKLQPQSSSSQTDWMETVLSYSLTFELWPFVQASTLSLTVCRRQHGLSSVSPLYRESVTVASN